MAKKRILVTGASGLLGLNFSLRYHGEYEIIGVVNQTKLSHLPFETLQRDFFNDGAAAGLIETAKTDAVLHCAAMANVDQCEKEPEAAAFVNGTVPALFAEEAKRRSIPFLHISTDAVFDGEKPGADGYRENDAANPINVYAETKLAGERNVLEANPEAIVARVNFYGWSISGRRSLSEFFYRSLLDGNRVSGFIDVVFCPLYVSDLARILSRLIWSSERGLFHVFGSRLLSKYEFGVEIAKTFGFDPGLIRPISWRDSGLTAVRSPNLVMNIDRLSAFLGGDVPDGIGGLDEFRSDLDSGFVKKIQEVRWN